LADQRILTLDEAISPVAAGVVATATGVVLMGARIAVSRLGKRDHGHRAVISGSC
jgi:hypothetical protein